jgi:hypothetical protein
MKEARRERRIERVGRCDVVIQEEMGERKESMRKTKKKACMCARAK